MGAFFLFQKSAALTVLSFSLIILAVCAYAFLYLRALLPKRGTLEWIAMYDRPAISPVPLGRLRGWEIPLAILLAIVAAGIYMGSVCLHLGPGPAFGTKAGRLLLAGGCGVFAMQSLAMYVLLRILTGRPDTALILGLLPALGIFADCGCVLGLCICMIPLAALLRKGPEEPLTRGMLWRILFAAACAASVQATPVLCIPVAFLLLAGLGSLLRRFHVSSSPDRGPEAVACLAVFCVSWALVSLIALALIRLVTLGDTAFYRSAAFYFDALTPWRAMARLEPSFVSFLFANPLTLLLGLAGAIVSFYTARRYGHPDVLLIPAAMAGVLTLLFLSGVNAVEAAAIPAIGYMTMRLQSRGRRAAAWICVGILFLFAALGDLHMLLPDILRNAG